MGGHFGERVIGTKRAEEESLIEETRANHFGHRVIGDVLLKRRLEARKDDGAKDSRSDPAAKQAKREAKADQRAETAAEIEVVDAPTTTNFEELRAALEGNDGFYEGLYASEFARPSGPRKSALRLFLVFEMEHEDRDDRKTEIEAALNPKG
jgi:hypothetical protein